MIRGWRNDPAWCAYYLELAVYRRSRIDAIHQEKQLAEMINMQQSAAETQSAGLRLHETQLAEVRKHNAECHARKTASGEIEPDTTNYHKLNG